MKHPAHVIREVPATLGRDQTRPGGIPGFPTEFDSTSKALQDYIYDKFTWAPASLLAWKLLGMDGGPVDLWLQRYVAISKELKKPYSKTDWPQWQAIFVDRFDYEPDIVENYFRYFRELRSNGKVPDSIWNPSSYVEAPSVIEKILNPVTATAKSVAFKGNVVFYGAIAIGGIILYQWLGKKTGVRA